MPLHPREVLVTKDRLARPSSWVTSFPLPHDSLGVGDWAKSHGPMHWQQLGRGPQPQWPMPVAWREAAARRAMSNEVDGLSKRGSRVEHRARGGGGEAYRAMTQHGGGGRGPTWWCFEAAVNSGGRRLPVASLGDRGG
jgi:hypothetical protein